MLAAGAGGTGGVDPDVLRLDLDVDLLGLGQHRDGRRRGVDAAARLGCRDALDAVDAGFELQPREHATAAHLGDDLLEAAGFALALRQHLDLPAVEVGIALVHAEQVAGEQRRLAAAGAGPDLEDRALLVGRVPRQEQLPDGIDQDLDPLVESGGLLAGDLAHLGIVEQRLELAPFALGLP